MRYFIFLIALVYCLGCGRSNLDESPEWPKNDSVVIDIDSNQILSELRTKNPHSAKSIISELSKLSMKTGINVVHLAAELDRKITIDCDDQGECNFNEGAK